MITSTVKNNQYSYQRLVAGFCQKVIVELGSNPLDEAGMKFFEQESGEVRWYPFKPDDIELQEVKRRLSQRRRRSNPLIDMAKLRKKPRSRIQAKTACPAR